MASSDVGFQTVRTLLRTRYDPLFNFYFAKDINDLCYSRPHFK